jgi:hypothetical protein
MGRIPLDRAAIERELGVALAPEYLERLMFRSTLTIRGLKSGFTGQEAQTIIPHQATVAFDARLVKNQRVETVYRRILEHIRGQGFTVIESPDAPIPDDLRGRAIRVVEQRGYDPAKTAADLPVSRRVIEVVERAHGGEPAVVLPTMGGSVPLWAFTDILTGIPSDNGGRRVTPSPKRIKDGRSGIADHRPHLGEATGTRNVGESCLSRDFRFGSISFLGSHWRVGDVTPSSPCCPLSTGETARCRGARAADLASSESWPPSLATLPPASALFSAWAIRLITSNATRAARCAGESAERGCPLSSFRRVAG